VFSLLWLYFVMLKNLFEQLNLLLIMYRGILICRLGKFLKQMIKKLFAIFHIILFSFVA
jgi:hypothetical protein